MEEEKSAEKNVSIKEEAREAEQAVDNERLKLWNPKSACNWSVLFTPVFGAYIQAQNWSKLGHENKAKTSIVWCYVSIIYLLIIPFVNIPEPFGRLSPIGLILIWYLTSGKVQMEYVAYQGIDYEKKSWIKPILVGLSCTAVYFSVLIGMTSLFSPPLNQLLEVNSKTLVNQVVHEQFKQTVSCTRVEIIEKVSDKEYTANAYMDDGTVRVVKLTFDGANLYVEVTSTPSN